MRRAAIAIAVAALACAGSAQAEVSDAFGNTVISRYSDGGWVKHFFEPDGRYTAQFSDGRRLAARWSAEGNRICLSNMRPSMIIPRFCTQMVDAEVGESWASRDPLGRRVRNELIAGR